MPRWFSHLIVFTALCGAATLASADVPPEDILAQLILLDERGEARAAKAGGLGATPGMFFAFGPRGVAIACNAFHGYDTDQHGWAFTAGHCDRKAEEAHAEDSYFVFYHNRNGKKVVLKAEGVAVPFTIPTKNREGEAIEYKVDLVAYPIDRRQADFWDKADFLSAASAPEPLPANHKFAMLSYELELDASQRFAKIPRARLKRHECPGTSGAMPRFRATWKGDRAGEIFSENWAISYTNQSSEMDETSGLFLHGCHTKNPEPSGALVFDERGPAGLYLNTMAMISFKKTWRADLEDRFASHLTDKFANATPEKTILEFLPNFANAPNLVFQLEDRARPFYAVAVDFKTIKKTAQPFIERLGRE
jgi:hypothetical protein